MNITNQFVTPKCPNSTSLIDVSAKDIYSKIKLVVLFGAACLTAFIVFIIQVILWGNESSNLFMMNPLISGYLHASLNHFVSNLFLIFLLLIPAINRVLSFRELFYITTVLSLLYLPISISGLTPPAIGLSGTCCYLGGRYAWTRKKWHVIAKIFLILLIYVEGNNFMQPLDGEAHLMHVLGMMAGVCSIVIKNVRSN
jgi:hypothetical protein